MNKERNRGVMLFVSVLLHGLLVLLPWPQKSRPLTVSSTPASPIPIVDASQLPTIPTSESQPLLADPPSPPAPTVPLPPPVDPPRTPDTSIPEQSGSPIDVPVPSTVLTPEDSIPKANDSPIGENAPAAAPNAVPNANPTPVTPTEEGAKIAAEEWDHFVGYLADQDDGFGFKLSDIFEFFGTPIQISQFNQFFKDENDDSEIHVFDFNHFPTQTPEQVLQTVIIPELDNNTGFELQPEENFSAGRAYQLLQGEMLRYLIIVRLREGEGSVLILSESLPRLES